MSKASGYYKSIHLVRLPQSSTFHVPKLLWGVPDAKSSRLLQKTNALLVCLGVLVSIVLFVKADLDSASKLRR